MTENEETADELADEEEQGIIDRLINVFLDPAALFKGLAKKPEFWTPIIVVGIITAIMTAAIFPVQHKIGWEIRKAQLVSSEADEDEIAKEGEKYFNPTGKKIGMGIAIVFGFIVNPIAWLVTAGVIFVISLIQGLDTSFRRVFSVVAYASIIRIIGSWVIDNVIKLAQNVETVEAWSRSKISLATLLPPDAPGPLVAVMSAIDPFFIWFLVVLVIGLTFANKCKLKAAITTTVIYLVIVLAVKAGLGLLGLVFGGGQGGGGDVRVQVN